jgi:hypothetical protein
VTYLRYLALPRPSPRDSPPKPVVSLSPSSPNGIERGRRSARSSLSKPFGTTHEWTVRVPVPINGQMQATPPPTQPPRPRTSSAGSSGRRSGSREPSRPPGYGAELLSQVMGPGSTSSDRVFRPVVSPGQSFGSIALRRPTVSPGPHDNNGRGSPGLDMSRGSPVRDPYGLEMKVKGIRYSR